MKILQKIEKNSVDFDIVTFNIISNQQAEIYNQSQKINHLEKQIEWFKDQFKLASSRQFGKSSETTAARRTGRARK